MDKQINITFLKEEICKEIVSYIIQDENLDYDIAIDKFYSSETFKKLSDNETGLYLESSAYIYSLFKQELILGKFPHI